MNHRVRARAKFFFKDNHKFFLKGVTYGTFAPDPQGYYVGPPEKARLDLSMMREIGVNGVRVYHAPPKWFLDLAYEFGIRVMVTLWWGQNVDFLSSGKRRREIFEKVDSDVKSNAGHPGLFGYLVANEISSTMVRWYGVRRVTEFVENMINVGRDADDDVLFSYASYPPTEYLLPTNMDFYTFNVYLHRRSDFDRYLARLQNLAEDRPLIMGEFGMDTLRHPEEEPELMRTTRRLVHKPVALAGGLPFGAPAAATSPCRAFMNKPHPFPALPNLLLLKLPHTTAGCMILGTLETNHRPSRRGVRALTRG